MRLLILTQAIDKNDPVLSAYHRLVLEIVGRFEKATVICLKKGEHNMPKHVEVLSLGKETGESRIKYLCNFYRYIFSRASNYDAVFVHMNQEYILLGGLFWKMMGKRIYLWRNHHAGSFLTDIAAAFCTKVFCTSKFSYTKKYKKTILMPVGIDTDMFKPDPSVSRKKDSILFLGRVSPVKKPHVLLEALGLLKSADVPFAAHIYGDTPSGDAAYRKKLLADRSRYNLDAEVSFEKGIPNSDTPKVYSQHGIFVNLSSSGMYDKTIFEAMACGCISIASNENLRGEVPNDLVFQEDDAKELSEKLRKALSSYDTFNKEALRKYVRENHGLSLLGEKLSVSMR